MTFLKCLLLSSAAALVVSTGAQGADLPTRKAAPVEYVRVCNVGGVTGSVFRESVEPLLAESATAGGA